ncbi:FAD-dependent oxidoreductase [Breoghania sp. L-A4]|uniref:dihydrolipoyl dehydrogenase family protein n=1 Tax=Breoghania sp. L-A4 TaxID=2304600 RepID=UPI000E35CFB1|nr:FAD-dependent oxidoreductase [Breoghania sp. L-A4]AXS39228.1 dihydrolipoamide dehydrogenase [Breoghania sp. L-A4]
MTDRSPSSSGTLLTPDICVIGAGSGGLSVAAAAVAFGVDVVLVEKGKMGGDCLNYGCVPSKALVAAAKHAHGIREAAAFGVNAGDPQVDFARVHAHVHEVIASIAPHDSVERFEGLGVRVLQDEARFVDARTVSAGGHTIRARRFVIATGASPMVPPIPGLDDVSYLTNETIFDLTECPGHLVIIGGGPIGMELAQAFRRLGARVTVLEAMKALGKDDPDLAGIVLERLRAEGIDIREGAKVARVEQRGAGVAVHVESDDAPAEAAIEGSHLLVATGRRPNLAGLDLDAAGIIHDRRGIIVDRGLRTSNRRVYAIGDVAAGEEAGGLQFTHVAGYHAGLVIRSILFRMPVHENRGIIPWVTFTDPELASAGLSEAEARARHSDIRVLSSAYAENDRARAERRTEGSIKVITDSRGRILGAAIAGANAGEIINMWALAVSQKMKIKAFTGFISPYPTMAEIGKRAAIGFYTPSLANPWLRRLIRFLRVFG